MAPLIFILAILLQATAIAETAQELKVASQKLKLARKAFHKDDDFSRALKLAKRALVVEPPPGSEESKGKAILLEALDKLAAKKFSDAELILYKFDDLYLDEGSLYQRQARLLKNIAKNAQVVQRLQAATARIR